MRFGRGVRGKLSAELADRRCLIVTTARGRQQLESDPALRALSRSPAVRWVDTVQPNPERTALQAAIETLRHETFEAVIAFGGGSALDSAKVLNVALADGAVTHNLSELLADPRCHRDARPRPLYAIPTTAGTGSEVTPFATVWDRADGQKHSLAGAAVYPYAAVIDPALTDGLPREITRATGLDAINQAAESVWNRNATPITLQLAARALRLGFETLPELVASDLGTQQDPHRCVHLRDRLAEASLLAGLCISQTRTALCHSISYPITAHFGVPHGLACAFTAPAVLRYNATVDDGRLRQVACDLFGRRTTAGEFVESFTRLHQSLDVGPLTRQAIPSEQALLDLIPQMYTPGRADNNLREVDADALEQILRQAWSDAAG
ncbi:alcohol dehydrogenase [Halorhodospira abdelmalekii]|nr:alcohol dehydrogenase [Halorhodospira abdelmalekii]